VMNKNDLRQYKANLLGNVGFSPFLPYLATKRTSPPFKSTCKVGTFHYYYIERMGYNNDTE
jgi:hypothetical protein